MREKLEPPKPCPVCSQEMQATKQYGRTIYSCEQCGTVVMISEPRAFADA
jgi:ribosomal protein L37AE/L43A